MQIKTIIIDDEAHCIESLSLDLEKYCPDIEIVHKTASSKDGLTAIKKLKPDLVFLDIEMPWMNGFEMLELLHPFTFEVIFVTAFDSYAIDAFKVSAIDYLMKPVDKEDLIRSVEKVKQRLSSSVSDGEKIHAMLETFFNSQQHKKIIFSERNKQQFVDPSQILYVKAESNYSQVFLEGQKSLTLSFTLKSIEEKLKDYEFLRVHHSYLVNMNKVTQYIKAEGGYLMVGENTMIPISRSKRSDLKTFLETDFN